MTLADGTDARAALRALLHSALDLPPEERTAFVAARLPEGTLLTEALALLGEVESVDGFLEAPFDPSLAPFRPALPERIGRYTIERVLGYGSMGVVYLARQTGPTRLVALKLLRIDQVGAGTVDRFGREAEVLARLAHPGIARVYDVGVADLGAGQQPWFVMEYVEGERLLEHAQQAQLDRRSRVRLVVDIARAVQHAHAAGVVHRDLKPENVLVRPDGSACVLDFGVARLVAEDDALTRLTGTGQVIGTLSYMAPEQARGGAVDARADQYALGVILYELLTGALPLDLRGRLMHDALRVIADGTTTPASRHDPTLAGDLDAILATALAPEPNRRYPSVGALADDLERWLAGRRVVARRPSALEGAMRFVRRHPLAVLLVAVASTVVGVVATLAVQARLDQRQSDRLALLFADRALQESLVAEVDELWPADSKRLPALETWLAEARGLAARLGHHRKFVQDRALLGQSGRASTSVEREHAEGWLVEQGEALVAGIESLLADGGLVAQLEARRKRAATLLDESVTTRLADWAAAAARVRADPRFGGLELLPQEGLVPLGPDPSSGLEEFAVLSTGAVPERDARTQRVLPRLGDALTLVLIPGGERSIGCQAENEQAPNYVKGQTEVHPHTGPPVDVRLDSYFISKFELTQDQWSRMTGSNPSYYEPGHVSRGGTVTGLHPVETVTWLEILRLLPRYGLTLPTEAQWEVAARGDSPWAFLVGPSPMDLVGHANCDTDGEYGGQVPAGFPDDGHSVPWPVGTGTPNPFGLYDVLGNVSECCLDVFKVDYHELGHRDGDGLVLAEPDGDVPRRGGNGTHPPRSLDVYARGDKRLDSNDNYTGVRPVWAARLRHAANVR